MFSQLLLPLAWLYSISISSIVYCVALMLILSLSHSPYFIARWRIAFTHGIFFIIIFIRVDDIYYERTDKTKTACVNKTRGLPMLCHASLLSSFFLSSLMVQLLLLYERTATFDGLRVKTSFIRSNTYVYISYTQCSAIYIPFFVVLYFIFCRSPSHSVCENSFYVLDTLKWILLCTHSTCML